MTDTAVLNRSAYAKLNDTGFNLFSRLVWLYEQQNGPFAYSSEQASHDLQLSERTIKTALKDLKELGYISVNNSTRPRLISISAPIFKADDLAPAPVVSEATSFDSDYSLFSYLQANGYQCPNFILHHSKRFASYDIEPLCSDIRTNLWHFDLSGLMEASGLYLLPFGQSHSFKFDFTPLKTLLAPINATYNNSASFAPNNMAYCFRYAGWGAILKEFFIFSLVIELTSGAYDCFTDHTKIDPYGGNFASIWYEYQHGPLFTCLNACYQDSNSIEGLRQRIAFKYQPAKGKLLDFAISCICQEVCALLSNEDTAKLCFEAFKKAFYEYGAKQSYITNSRINSPDSDLWLNQVWGPKLNRGLLNYDSLGYIPRLSCPLLLLRTLVGMNEISGLNEGPGPLKERQAIAVLIKSMRRSPYKGEYFKLANCLQSRFAFLLKLQAHFKELEQGELLSHE